MPPELPYRLSHPGQTLEEKAQIKSEVYDPLALILEETVQTITQQEPKQWLKTAYRSVRELEQALETDAYPEPVKHYLSSYLEDILQVLRGEFSVPPADTPEAQTRLVNERCQSVIHAISDLLAVELREKIPVEVQSRSLESILNQELAHGYQLRLTPHVTDPNLVDLEIYSPFQQQWFSFPLPPTSHMVHKGGFPRTVLKIMSGAPVETIESELPPNDFDVITWGQEGDVLATAEKIGVDPSGVESIHAETPDFAELLRSRDITLNSCFIGKDGLIYSTEAEQAAQSGHIAPLPSYRGLYGSNMFYYQGEPLYTGRDMLRAIKFVAEGKALSFSFNELNKQVDMGIYLLVLTEKFLCKSNWPELLDKMFYLLRQTGQVQPEEESIWQVLDRFHAQYPFFEIEDRAIPDETAVSLWLMKKLGKQALNTFKSLYAIPSTMELQRTPQDTQPQTISLEGYSNTSLDLDRQLDQLENFLIRCEARFQEYLGSNGLPTGPRYMDDPLLPQEQRSA